MVRSPLLLQPRDAMGSEPRFRNLLRSKHMFDLIKFAIKAGAADRKGVTAVE